MSVSEEGQDAPKTRRLKVLFITPWYPTTEEPVSGVFVREHAKAVRLYDDVVVLHYARKPDLRQVWRMDRETDPELTEGILTYHVWHRTSPVPRTSYVLHLWAAWRAFRQITRQTFTPDIVHAHIYDAGFVAVLLGALNKIPVVITEHNSDFPRRRLARSAVERARFAFRQAARVLPVSLALQKGIEQYGINADFTIVPNAVDTALFAPLGRRVEHAVPYRLLFVGSLIPVKGLPDLLEALARLPEANVRLDIVGDGPARAEYEQYARDLGLNERVAFHGRKTKVEVAAFMRRADLFVLPSHWENLPCVLIESMASGLPILSTTAGGIPEIVDPDSGVLVPPGDPAALAAALERMLRTLPLIDRDTLAERAQRYSMKSVGRSLDHVYRQVLEHESVH